MFNLQRNNFEFQAFSTRIECLLVRYFILLELSETVSCLWVILLHREKKISQKRQINQWLRPSIEAANLKTGDSPSDTNIDVKGRMKNDILRERVGLSCCADFLTITPSQSLPNVNFRRFVNKTNNVGTVLHSRSWLILDECSVSFSLFSSGQAPPCWHPWPLSPRCHIYPWIPFYLKQHGVR